MPKIKMPKSTPSLDMTPMVDLAFLLVTFFMLTSSFREQEAVVVNSPRASSADLVLPEKAFVVSISQKGQVFIDITDQAIRPFVFEKAYKSIMGTDKAPEKYLTLAKKVATYGLSMEKTLNYLETEPANRSDLKMDGIPFDTALRKNEDIQKTQLYMWAEAAYKTAVEEWKLRKEEFPNLQIEDLMKFCIKADRESDYKLVKKVMDVFLLAEVPHFQIITNFEEDMERRGTR